MPTAVNNRSAPVFLGGHLAMDFLNSIENLSDISTDWMSDGLGLVGWLERAKIIDAMFAARIVKETDRRVLDAIAGKARKLREWLREFLTGPARHQKVPRANTSVAPLNRVLADDDSYGQIVNRRRPNEVESHFQFRRLNRWKTPSQLLQPIATAIVRLICEEDLGLVRACEGQTCTLILLDKTKRRGRRWCSMAVCGNRAKAAAHRAKSRNA
jgi:predicted RNA-binding Zn ribbon-like protein